MTRPLPLLALSLCLSTLTALGPGCGACAPPPGDGDGDGDGDTGDGDGDTGDGDGDGDGDTGDGDGDGDLEVDGEELCRITIAGFGKIAFLALSSLTQCMPGDPWPPEGYAEDLEASLDEGCAPGTPDREVFDALVERGRVEIDPQRVAGCLAAGRTAVGQVSTVAELYDLYLGFIPDGETVDFGQAPLCQGAFTPLGVEGQDCIASAECVAPLQCLLDLESHTTKCLPLAEEGDPCFESFDAQLQLPCAEGLDCVADVCVPLAGPGESCADVECKDALYCSSESGLTCQARVPEGGDCSGESPCEDGTFCSGASVCVSETPAGEGQPCYDGQRACAGACLTCRSPSPGEVSVCTLRGEEGDPCLQDSSCQVGLHCPDTVCEPLGGINDACAFDSDCEPDLVCEGSVCATPAGEGDPCTAVACADGLFCVDDLCVADPLGAPCSFDSDCLDEQVCLEAEPPAERVCGFPRAAGAACLASGDCAEGLYCAESVCEAQGAANALCTLDEECASDICRDGRCAGSAPTPTASCLANSGEALGLYVFFGCALGLRGLRGRGRRSRCRAAARP